MKYLAAIGAAALAFGTPAQAAIVVDQESAPHNEFNAQWDQANTIQSFTTQAGNLVGASIYGLFMGETGTLRIGLWSALPDPVTDPITGSHEIAFGTTRIEKTGWMDVFWNQVSVNPGQAYYLVLSANTRFGGYAGSTENPYAGGQAYANADRVTGRPMAYPTTDYAFRTYSEDGTVAPAVPEPATWAMMLVGFGALGAVMRRRRTAVAGEPWTLTR